MGDSDEGKNDLRNNFLNRFTDPKIDDPGLPLTDTLIAQVVAPTFQVFWLSLVHAPSPTWLRPIFDDTLWQYRGSLVAPTLIHGAALASCWVAGALAAEAFERKSYDLDEGGYSTVLWRLFKAGAFSTGILILATQIDLILEFGHYVQPGESAETDIRLLSALVEVLNDVFFEAIAIGSWRIYRASFTRK